MELPLTRLKNGETGVIISIEHKLHEHHTHHHARYRSHWSHKRGFQKRLEDMGLTPGAKVKLVKSAPFRGPIELSVRGSRLAVGRGMAKRIIVRVER